MMNCVVCSAKTIRWYDHVQFPLEHVMFICTVSFKEQTHGSEKRVCLGISSCCCYVKVWLYLKIACDFMVLVGLPAWRINHSAINSWYKLKIIYFSRYGTASNFSLFKSDYIKLYADTIKPIINHLDKTRTYVTSSPSNGLETEREGYVAKNPYDNKYGDGEATTNLSA